MQNCKPSYTPLVQGMKLTIKNVKNIENEKREEKSITRIEN